MQRLPPWLFPGLPKAGTERGFSAGPGLLQGPGAGCSGAPYDKCQDLHTLSSRRTSRRAGRRSREPSGLGTPSVASLPAQAQCPGAQGNGPKVAWSLGRSGLRLSLSSIPCFPGCGLRFSFHFSAFDSSQQRAPLPRRKGPPGESCSREGLTWASL